MNRPLQICGWLLARLMKRRCEVCSCWLSRYALMENLLRRPRQIEATVYLLTGQRQSRRVSWICSECALRSRPPSDPEPPRQPMHQIV